MHLYWIGEYDISHFVWTATKGNLLYMHRYGKSDKDLAI